MTSLLETQIPKPGLENSRRNLALSVLEEYHGPIVATVAEVLMRTERTTLAELTRLVQRDQGIMGVSRAGKTRTVVTASHVKESLLIMMHHNMVTVTMPTERELRRAKANASRNSNVRLYYTLQPLEALVRTRGPLFHYQATKELGRVAGMVVDCFLRHGRRTLPEVKREVLRRAEDLSRIREAQGAEPGGEGVNEEDTEDVTAGAIQKSFQKLVMAKYIDKVPKLDLVTAAPSPEKAKKPSMTFGTASTGTKGSGGARGGGKNAGQQANGKNTELEARQRKGAAQTVARKRRMIGDSSGSAGGVNVNGRESLDGSDEEDELPVEMREMLSRVGAGSGSSSGAGLDSRPPPSKRRRHVDEADRGDSPANASRSARTRGRGRSRGRGGHRGEIVKDHVKDINMDGVFHQWGGDIEGEDVALGEGFGSVGPRPSGLGALGATVLDGVVWRLGFEKFHRDFRNSTLLGLVQDRFPRSNLAYLAVKVMLDDSAPTERKLKEQATPGMSATTLFDKLCDAWLTNDFTKKKARPEWGRFMTWMGALCTDLTGMVSTISGSDRQNPKYMVNIASMVQYIRSKLVKCTVRDRYGKETARIMEILLQNKFLEQQQIGEMAMLPPGDARTRLYRLLRDRMVSMQEVPKRADRNPNATFFLWTIKHDQVNQVVTDSLYKAMLNMRLRRKFVYSNDKELFIHDAAARLSNDTEKERLDQVRRSLDRLDTALLHLDETLMLFDTF